MLPIRYDNVVQMPTMELVPPSEEPTAAQLLRPASPFDVLDADGVMAEVLHISDSRTLNKLIDEEKLPVHRGARGRRLFIRGDVLDWLKVRCTTTAPDRKAAG